MLCALAVALRNAVLSLSVVHDVADAYSLVETMWQGSWRSQMCDVTRLRAMQCDWPGEG